MRTRLAFAVVPLTLLLLAAGACDDDDDISEQTGAACEKVEDCFPKVMEPLKGGAAMCLTRVTGGYCTHLCESDADCCAVEGECPAGLPQVCAPFESTGMKMCFLSCESAVVMADEDPESSETAYCQRHAHESFNCRSTGGGSQNRKVCVP